MKDKLHLTEAGLEEIRKIKLSMNRGRNLDSDKNPESMFVSASFFSILDSLLTILPVLIGVVFVTVAERKTLGSMQRRLGPNVTGVYGSLQTSENKRKFHTFSFMCNSKKINIDFSQSMQIKAAIDTLYKDRVAPTKIFDSNILYTCDNYLDLKEKKKFLDKLENLGGIYLIQYKYDSLIYYIGRSNKFKLKFKSHIIRSYKDKFHIFGNVVG